MTKNKDFDELFRDKLRDFEQSPPPHLLDNILVATATKRQKKRLVIWRLTGVAAALLVAFVAGWQIKDMMNVNQLSETTQSVKEIKVIPEASVIGNENKSLEKSSPLIAGLAAAKRTTGLSKPEEDVKISFSGKNADTTENINLKELKNEPIALLKSLAYMPDKLLKKTTQLILNNSKKSDQKLGLLSVDEQIIRQNQQSILSQKLANEKNRWTIGAQVSPVYSDSHSSHSSVYAANMLNSAKTNAVDLGGGLSVAVKTGKRFSIQSGIYYSALEQSSGNTVHTRSNDMFAGQGSNYLNTNVNVDAVNNKMSVNAAAGVISMDGIPEGVDLATNIEEKALSSTVMVSEVNVSQNFEYLEIPVYLRYTIIDRKFGVEMIGGVSSNVLVSNQVYLEGTSGNNLIGETEDMESVSYSGSFGLGFKYGLSKHFYLNVEPRIKYYLNSLSNNSSVSYKPYTVGVYTGLSYQF